MQIINDTTSENLFVSVIIPVYNDADHLKICLEALEIQTYPNSSYEVVVVDNGSKEDVEAVASRFDQVVLCDEAKPGSYAARNKGISVSQGEVLAFTDSDCIPARDWIEKGVKNIWEKANCGLIAGKVNMFYRDPNRLTAVELYEKLYAFNQQDNVNKKKFGVTANLFTRRGVLDTVGLFNASLKSGGDLEWGNRVYNSGHALIYADNVCVEHPARHSLRQLYNKRMRVLGGLNTITREALYSFNNAFFDLKKIVWNTLWLAKRFFLNLSPSEKFENTRQKIQYLFIDSYVQMISVFEKLRLQKGGKVHR